ncbi:hypothetical protein O6H91_Y251900 [Diphasiastrum complanatum]|nr:hypothetical protein O6H91_Y251900 [Diphasiastrum complanatum]
MYGRCKSLDTAQEIFEKLVKKEVEAWNALIAAYGENGQEKKALELFNQMQQEGLVANKSTVLSILRALSGPASLAEGKLIHALIVERGLSLDIDVVNTLMHMYIKCDLVDEAQVLFERMPKKDLSSWNVLLGAFAHQSNGLRALEMFARMQREGFKGNKHTYVHLFNACANCALLAEGKQLHSSLFGTEWERDVLVSSALIYMYGKFSNLDEARQIFDRVPEKDVASWNAMIAAYANNGDGNKVAQLYDSMQKEGIKPTKHIFLNLLGAFVNPSQLAKAKIIHVHIIQNEYESDLAVGNALISMYGRCGDLQCALEIFNRMPERSTATWNAMIAACVQIGDSSMARKLFYQMPEEGMQYDKTTFVSILGACSSPEELVEGRNIHNLIREEGLELDVVVGTSLISMYDNCGSREEARQTFDKLSQRDVAAWNAIIATYAREGNQKVALELFKTMQQEDLEPDRFTFVNLLSACTTATSLEDGKFIQACAIEKGLETDVVVGTALVDMYGRCGTVADARQMFEKISHRDSSAWNTMVKLYIQNNLDKDALLLFKQMQLEGGRPNRTNLLGIFNVCAKLKVLSDAKMISTRLDDYEVDLDVEAGNVMVNMFVKCGSLQEAKEVFDKMLNRDAVTWSTLISAYAQEGSGKFALQLFAQMQQQGIKPNNASLANVLNAISNVGPLEEACDYFNSKIVDKGIQQSVQQYGSMVNLLGQKGRLDEAEDFIAKTPYKDDKAMWMALLGACRVHGDVDRGKRAAEKLLQLDPQTSAPYVMLSNIYASSGRWEAKARVRRVMAEKGIKKQPGISAIEVHGKMHEFMVRDRSHPRSKEIYAELERLTAAIKKAGYVPDTSQVLHNVASEKEKEWLLNTHSERLAICYGLITTPPGTPLRIIKNLRVCPDCHVATKFICKVTGRDIIVRDGKRFHHVSKDGTCSCNDYW